MLINIDHKALEHACQCAGRSVHHFDRMGDDLPLRASIIAHARAIEQHEAFRQEVSDAMKLLSEEHEAFRQKVSDAVENVRRVVKPLAWDQAIGPLISRFIIAKPDPLEEVMEELVNYSRIIDAASIRAAIEKRGGKIVWREG